jgi:hypothetical protein
MKKLIQILGCLGAAAILAPAVSLTSTNTGWYFANGFAAANNFLTTGPLNGGYNSFVVFDLNGQTGTVNNATLTIQNPVNNSQPVGAWMGTLMLWDLNNGTPINNSASGLLSFHASGSATGLGIFNDLGSGTMFASAAYTNNGNAIQLALNSSGIAAIQAAANGSTLVAFGMTLTGNGDYAFNYAPDTQNGLLPVLQFDLTAGNQGGGGQGGGAVPEPRTVALMGAALAGLGWMRRK